MLPSIALFSFLSQGKKPTQHDVTLNDRNDGTIQTRQQNMNIDRAAQLEQNMKFLQEQHQATLLALHQEVETLRQRNRGIRNDDCGILYFISYLILLYFLRPIPFVS